MTPPADENSPEAVETSEPAESSRPGEMSEHGDKGGAEVSSDEDKDDEASEEPLPKTGDSACHTAILSAVADWVHETTERLCQTLASVSRQIRQMEVPTTGSRQNSLSVR
jgi:hypothetical protein